jgi:flagellar secretion chaperone FliS
MNRNPALSYRQMVARSSTPMGLVVMLYDIVLEGINRALEALSTGDIELRSSELSRALAAIGELQASLDFHRGGDVARRLEQFYNLMRGKILEAQIRASEKTLREVAGHIACMRGAWQEIERQLPSAAKSLLPELPVWAGQSETGDGNAVRTSRWSA